MFFKKLIALLLAAAMLFCTVPVSAGQAAVDKGSDAPSTLYYKGGVVLRTIPRGTSDGDLIQVAYVLTDSPYIILNQPTTWEVTITGGTAPYTVEALLANQDDLSLDQFEDVWYVTDSFTLSGDTFTYTFTGPGRYFWEFSVTDSNGQSLTFQTRIYEAYTSADEGDNKTVVGKANEIVADLIHGGMSDYQRARVLHDWIIDNANYDYTYTYYDAAGVLLYGTGVCDSYARAYLMLCTIAGLDCMYVSGTAGNDPDPDEWGNHGWNLVKLGGSWYHVDCTWDDPGTGGSENHNYFCVDDATMSKDHRWNTPDDIFDDGGMVIPDAEGGEYEGADSETVDHDFTFASIDEYDAALDKLIAAGEFREHIVGLYTGNEDYAVVWEAFGEWLNEKVQELANRGLVTAAGYSYEGPAFTASLTWTDPVDYIRIDEESVLIDVGDTLAILPAEYVPDSNSFTWTSSNPSVATVEAHYYSEGGLVALITGESAGTATITAISSDGLSDSLKVTVLPTYQPDFDLTLTENDEELVFKWNGIPGMTEYHIVSIEDESHIVVASTTDTEITLAVQDLASESYQFYLLALRKAGGYTLDYSSEVLTYSNKQDITYTAVLPAGTKTIDAQAFYGDKSLTAVYIPDGAQTIGSGAFSGCTSLKAVRIPETVTSIASNAFAECPLKYAEVTKGSFADTWLSQNLSSVIIIYE